jgi:hemolysin D
VEIDCTTAHNKVLCSRITPGMAVQAEIRTGTRRIIDYLLSPLTKSVTEAARER